MPQLVGESEFPRYLRSLRAINRIALASRGLPYTDADRAAEHLDGKASRELRQTVPLADLRELGAFFTGERLAKRVAGMASSWPTWKLAVDPACGCGDLLLPVARQLPMKESLEETLMLWGASLGGADVVPEFIDVTRERLLLLAIQRGASQSDATDLDLRELLPRFFVGDGRSHPMVGEAGLVLVNPPFGSVIAPSQTTWAEGRVTDAALWLSEIADRLRESAQLVALLPDVLRSGSRYEAWRQHTGKQMEVTSLESLGQFDPKTDIDVFGLAALKPAKAKSDTSSWPSMNEGGRTVGDQCAVMVGPVVEHRDPIAGPSVPYITSRDLPQSGEHVPTQSRRFSKRLFKPPFVVIRRTSRPTDRETRLRPVVIRGTRPVAVENHLIVLRPNHATVRECKRIVKILKSEDSTAWLNVRIRTRHLTTAAVKGIPARSELDPQKGSPA